MATLVELRQLFADSDLRAKLCSAIIIKAFGVLNAADQPQSRREWAVRAFTNTEAEADLLYKYLLAAHADLPAPAILAASDEAIKNSVNAAVDAIFK